MTLCKEKVFHYCVMLLISVIILLSIGFVYLSTNGSLKKQPIPSELVSSEEAGSAKPLPEYMLKTLKSDELEQLKP